MSGKSSGKLRKISSSITILLCLMLVLTGCSNSSNDDNPKEPDVTITETPTAEPTVEPTEAPTAVPTEAPKLEPTEAPTAEPTEEPTDYPTEEPTVTPDDSSDHKKVFSSTPEGMPENAVLLDDYYFKNEHFKIRISDNVYYICGDDNIIDFYNFSNVPIYSIATVDNMDEAVALLDSRGGYGYYTNDYVYLLLYPESGAPVDDVDSYDEKLSFMIHDLEPLDDNQTYNAYNSVKPEHLRVLFDFLYRNSPFICDWTNEDVYSLDSCLYYDVETKAYSDDQFMIVDDGNEYLMDSEPEDYLPGSSKLLPFDCNNDGRNEYVFMKTVTGDVTDYYVYAGERKNAKSDTLTRYNLDKKKLNDDIKNRLSETSLSGEDFNLKFIDFTREDDYGRYGIDTHSVRNIKMLFSIIPADVDLSDIDQTDEYYYSNFPIAVVSVNYKGKGNFKLTDVALKNQAIPDAPDFEIKEVPDHDYYRTNIHIYRDDPEYDCKLFEILSIDSDGTVVLREVDFWTDDSGWGGYFPTEPKVTMKLADDCTILYMSKTVGDLQERIITASDLKYIVDNYFYIFDVDLYLAEYNQGFECYFKDGVIYAMSEMYYP